MKLSDVLTNPKNGRLSHTKLWSNVGFLSLTVAFLYRAYAGVGSVEMEMLIYGIITTAPHLLGKLMSARFGGGIDLSQTEAKEENK